MNPEGEEDCFRIVPWSNSEEFIKVYNNLYSDNICQQRDAVDQVSVWRTRSGQTPLPNAIEATVGIVSAIIQETLYVAQRSPQEELDVRILYCAAIIRFFSLTLEQHQKATGEISLSALAAMHNIPTWLVDLRNEAVHSYMPTRSLLRAGADTAMKYLKESFWSKEAAERKQINYPHSGLKTEILALIKRYKDFQFKRIIEFLSEEQSKHLSKNLKAVLKKMSFILSHHREEFIDVLAEPGTFISYEDLNILLNSKAIKFLEQPNFIIPYKLQKFWFPLLCKIHKKDLMLLFLEQVLVAQGECYNKICHKLAIAWAFEIFEGPNSKSLLTPLFVKKGLVINPLSFVCACVIRPNHYTKDLLIRVIEKVPEEQKEIYTRFCPLVAMYLGYFVSEEDLKRKRDSIIDEIIFTVEDVEEYKNEVREKEMRAKNIVNHWSMASATMDFSSIPLGAIINNKKDENSSDDSWKNMIKLEPSIDDDFIIGENVDPNDIMDEPSTSSFKTELTIPEDFDMVYRKRPNK